MLEQGKSFVVVVVCVFLLFINQCFYQAILRLLSSLGIFLYECFKSSSTICATFTSVADVFRMHLIRSFASLFASFLYLYRSNSSSSKKPYRLYISRYFSAHSACTLLVLLVFFEATSKYSLPSSLRRSSSPNLELWLNKSITGNSFPLTANNHGAFV